MRTALYVTVLLLCAPLPAIADNEPALANAPSAVTAQDYEELVVRVEVNGTDKGDIFVLRGESGAFYMKGEDLRDIGLAPEGIEYVEISGAKYAELGKIKGIAVSFDEGKVALLLDAAPALLGTNTLSLQTRYKGDLAVSRQRSAYLNYSFTLSGGVEDRSEASFEAAARSGSMLLFTDALYTDTSIAQEFVRLTTYALWDDEARLVQYTLGDFQSPDMLYAGSSYIGGVRIRKAYNISPAFVETPAFGLHGYASSPSKMEVFSSGVLVHSERIAPGEFDITDIPPRGGVNDVKVVVTDAYGRERTFQTDGYFSSNLIRAGLSEYDFGAGLLRSAYGTADSAYANTVVFGKYYYGLSDRTTLGVSGGGSSEAFNLGPSGAFALGRGGAVEISAMLSQSGADGFGFAEHLGYEYVGMSRNMWMSYTGYSEGFHAYNQYSPLGTAFVFGAGAGIGSGSAGHLGVSYNITQRYTEGDTKRLSVSYSKSLPMGVFLTAGLTNEERPDATETVVMVNVSWRSSRGHTVTAQSESGGGSTSESLSVENTMPTGEGFGYRVTGAHRASDTETLTTLDPYMKYNGPFGVYQAEYVFTQSTLNTPDAYTVSASGSICATGGVIGFSRPVNDAFALVETPGLANVTVLANHNESGHTDRRGRLIVPSLMSYQENTVGLEPRDIPLGYSADDIEKYPVPAARGGVALKYGITRFSGYTGVLFYAGRDGRRVPVEFAEGAMRAGGKTIPFIAGMGGEFYFENAPPGTWPVTIVWEGRELGFTVTVPEALDAFTEIGEITVGAE